MPAKIINIEGVDASFKETNVVGLYNRLISEGRNVRMFSFPNYQSNSSALVKMYLNSEISETAEEVNAYASSSFYAVDRYATFKKEWEKFYHENDTNIVLLDRYVSSNMIHQASKINDVEEKRLFIDWLCDFEYVKMGIPVPDKIILLDMPPEIGHYVMHNRANKINGEQEKDLHEKSPQHLKNAYNNAIWVAENYGWSKVSCIKKDDYILLPNGLPDNIKTKEEMLSEVYQIAMN